MTEILITSALAEVVNYADEYNKTAYNSDAVVAVQY